MRLDTLEEKPSTCCQMYLRNPSLYQRLMIIIMNVETRVRYIAIAAPEQREWVPISSAVNLSVSLPRDFTVHQ